MSRSRLFSMVLYEGQTNLCSECSFVPNQAFYQAEPQPELKGRAATLIRPCFAYFTADGKEIEPVETVSLDFRYSDLFRDSNFGFRISELRDIAVLVSSTGIKYKGVRRGERLYHMAIQNPSMHFSVAIVGALIGIVILLFGRKLFWLCVAAVGFAAGVEIAPHLVNEPSPLLALTVALVLGLIGALLALFLQKIAIAVLGFLAGGKLAGAIAAAFLVQYAQHSAVVFVIGGIIGAILLLVLFDWALIVVSSLIGAHLIQSAIVLPASGSTIVFIGLVILGVLIQAASLRKSQA